MAKQITTILLLLAFLLQTFSRTAIVIEFYANQGYIARYLCENKDKPALKCCGKCRLNKQLKKEDSKDQENPERKLENKADIFEPAEPVFFGTASFEIAAILHAGYYNDNCSEGNVTVPFRPPSAQPHYLFYSAVTSLVAVPACNAGAYTA